jgi:hypothetical protein
MKEGNHILHPAHDHDRAHDLSVRDRIMIRIRIMSRTLPRWSPRSP